MKTFKHTTDSNNGCGRPRMTLTFWPEDEDGAVEVFSLWEDREIDGLWWDTQEDPIGTAYVYADNTDQEALEQASGTIEEYERELNQQFLGHL